LLVSFSVLWKLINTYRSVRDITSLIILGESGQQNSKVSSKFRRISAVCIRESIVWVGLNRYWRTKFEWLLSDLTCSADRNSENLMSGWYEWGVGLKIGSKPGGSKVCV
jgi:hypothetical protein